MGILGYGNGFEFYLLSLDRSGYHVEGMDGGRSNGEDLCRPMTVGGE